VGSQTDALIPIGLVLLVLGMGNWYTGVSKITEYERVVAATTMPPAGGTADDFPELTARTRTTLLRALGPEGDEDTAVRAKLDFYRVVHSGGRIVTLLGLFCAAAGLIRTWFRRRPDGRLPLALRV
jgi:hypothetical protein